MKKYSVIAFTGAGISAASGIPTFAEMGDLRTKLSRDYAKTNPKEYNEVIKQMSDYVSKATPNDAHVALSECNIPIITMNVDGLHTAAGSKNVIELHGTLPSEDELSVANSLKGKPVLYGDMAPAYEKAFEFVINKRPEFFLVVGVSGYTLITHQLIDTAMDVGSTVIYINENAEVDVRRFLEEDIHEV